VFSLDSYIFVVVFGCSSLLLFLFYVWLGLWIFVLFGCFFFLFLAELNRVSLRDVC